MDNAECLSSIVGKELKKLRKEAGYNLGQFAKLINKSEQQLFRYERCVNKIDIDTLINSLIILDTDIALFFTRITKIYNKEEDSLCRGFAPISPKLPTNHNYLIEFKIKKHSFRQNKTNTFFYLHLRD